MSRLEEFKEYFRSLGKQEKDLVLEELGKIREEANLSKPLDNEGIAENYYQGVKVKKKVVEEINNETWI